MIIVYALAAIGAATIALGALLFLPRKPLKTLRDQHLERWGNKP